MHYRIIDGKLYDWADYKYAEDCLETDIASKSDVDNSPEKYKVVGGALVDISETQDYKTKILEKENAEKINELRSQIDEIDKKRIRAICEPSLKDEQSGQTWLDYYNIQVQNLRNQIAELS